MSIDLSIHLSVYISAYVYLPIYLSKYLSLSICLFLDSSTSKNGPTLWCFYRFGFDICFAPQQRALFRALNFQKCSEAAMFLPFWLRNVLRASTACNFWSPSWPDISAPAALASLLFDPPEPQNIGKTRLSYLFARLDLLSSETLFFDLLSSSLLFADSSHLCFSSVNIVGSLTSKLPSIIYQ